MLSLFRKIRQKLLTQNRVTHYLAYAFGEIFLVVIGILIALQVNNWNENKKALANTSTYVDNLIEDLKKDISEFEARLQETRSDYSSSREIRKIFDKNSIISDTSKFIVELQQVGRLALPNISDNTFNDLISTGNIKLIKDKEIIEAIKNYYNYSSAWWYTDYRNQLVNGYLPIVANAIPMEIHEEILTKENPEAYEESINFSEGFDPNLIELENYEAKDVKVIMDALDGNPDFNFNLKRITRSHLVHINHLSNRRKSAEALLEKLESWKSENN